MNTARRYETSVVAILCLTWSVVNFETLGINFLLPFIAPSLRLSNTQVGILVSAFWIPFAVSSYLTGELTDRFGRRKLLLVYVLLLFAACSILPGLTDSFAALLATRLLMGLLEGPVLPLAQSIVALEVPSERRAVSMGIVQVVGAGLMSGFIAPLLLVELAVRYDWQLGFFVVAIPGALCALLVALCIRDPLQQRSTHNEGRTTQKRSGAAIKEILGYRNIWLCPLLACLFVAHYVVGVSYLPLFLVQTRHFEPQRMSVLMSVLGIASVVMGLLVPALADRVGRKTVGVVSSAFGVLCPLAALHYAGPWPVLGLLMFLGWAPVGASALYFATIPSESVPARAMSTAIGLTFAVGTLVGGAVAPTLAGWSADRWGLSAAVWLQVAVAASMAILSLGLRETMPARSAIPRPETAELPSQGSR